MTELCYVPGATGCIIDYEDSIEDDPDENGRWVNVNHDNDDLDSEADCLDYTDYNNSEENDFVKMRVVLDGPSIMRQSGTLRVTYSSWDTISDLPPYLYTVPLACLWKKEQTLQRDPYCIDRGGDYIDGKDNATGFGREYTVAQMGLHDRTQRHCWIEGIQPGAAVDKIRFLFEVDPDGPGPKPYAYPGDAVQARIVYPKVVVLDAGHGGKFPGNILTIDEEKYDDYMEKNFNLQVVKVAATALALGPTPLPTVILTRSTDEELHFNINEDLKARAQLALRHNADLFISIHINANPSPKPYGIETYVMGLHKSQDNLEVAIKENAAILMEDNYSAQYGGYDPNSPEAHIIFSLYQNAFLEQSLFLASQVQENVTGEVKLVDRGVKQAGFLVLYKTIMPGILVEAGFLSNAEDEKLLMDEKNLDKIAFAIYKAFVIYRNFIEKNKLSNEDIMSLILSFSRKNNQDYYERRKQKRMERIAALDNRKRMLLSDLDVSMKMLDNIKKPIQR